MERNIATSEPNVRKKRIILEGFDGKEFVGFDDELKKQNIDVIYWIGGKKSFRKYAQDTEKYPHTIFHHLFDVARGLPAASIDASLFSPLGKKIIDDLFECEIKVIAMMGLFDRENEVPLMHRKRKYHVSLKYWYGILVTMKPDAVFFADLPHKPHTTVIYHLAKRLGIRTLIFKRTQVDGRLIFFDDIKEYTTIKTEYNRINAEERIRPENLSPSMREYYIRQTCRKETLRNDCMITIRGYRAQIQLCAFCGRDLFFRR